jgi:hypothetical protein
MFLLCPSYWGNTSASGSEHVPEPLPDSPRRCGVPCRDQGLSEGCGDDHEPDHAGSQEQDDDECDPSNNETTKIFEVRHAVAFQSGNVSASQHFSQSVISRQVSAIW